MPSIHPAGFSRGPTIETDRPAATGVCAGLHAVVLGRDQKGLSAPLPLVSNPLAFPVSIAIARRMQHGYTESDSPGPEPPGERSSGEGVFSSSGRPIRVTGSRVPGRSRLFSLFPLLEGNGVPAVSDHARYRPVSALESAFSAKFTVPIPRSVRFPPALSFATRVTRCVPDWVGAPAETSVALSSFTRRHMSVAVFLGYGRRGVGGEVRHLR